LLELADQMVEIGQWEDEWDSMMERNGGPETDGVGWGSGWAVAAWAIQRTTEEDRIKTAILGAQMHDVVVRERALVKGADEVGDFNYLCFACKRRKKKEHEKLEVVGEEKESTG
jgi:hypothetical protein